MSMLKVLWLVPILLGCSQNHSDEDVNKALAKKGLTPVAKQEVGDKPSALPEGHPPLPPAEGRQSLGGISAEMPDGWQALSPSSSMRVAEYRLPGEQYGKEDAVLAVFYFGPNQGGGLEANIERWYGQFSQPDGGSTKERAKRWEKEANGMPVTMVDIRGTFDSGGMGMGGSSGPKPGYRMLGAIVQSPAGSFFFKLTGPQETVEGWAASFDQYIDALMPE